MTKNSITHAIPASPWPYQRPYCQMPLQWVLAILTQHPKLPEKESISNTLPGPTPGIPLIVSWTYIMNCTSQTHCTMSCITSTSWATL